MPENIFKTFELKFSGIFNAKEEIFFSNERFINKLYA